MSTTFKRLFSSILGLALIVSFVVPVGAAPASQSTTRKLSKHDRELLAEARVQGKSTVTLLIAAQPGANKTVASGIASLGGTVRFQDNDISYIRAIVPTGKAEAAAQLSGIQAANLDEIIPLDDPAPEASGDTTEAVPAPGAGTPNENAYMPTRDIGAPQFITANPTFDGRGVTVGIVDTGIDLAHPALQKTTTGERKVVDWVTATSATDDGDPTWIPMQDQVSGASFSYKTVTYTAPAAGSYRIALFNERDPRLGGEVGNDVNRDGNPAGSSGIFAILWDTTTNNVYVDTNQNNSFADEQAMTDYRVRNDVGYFGTDNPATQVAERMPFVVQTDGQNKFVNIGIVSGAHGTHVAGIVAANGMFGGAMNGAAPGAKLKAVRVCMFVSGCTAHALIEGMTFIAKQGNVDVINMSIGGLPALNDGNNTRAVLYNRLIEQYNVQMFISAGNSGPGINTVGDPSVASKVMSIGAYVTKETWEKNYGAAATKDEGMFVFSSRGPREDGGLKPNIVAPGSAVSTVPTWQLGGPVAGTYALPAGYAMFNGTSMASPQAAGGAALLVSAAKQSGVQYQPAQLRQSINSSARFIAGYGAHEQGNGLFQVGEAWKLLKTNIKTVGITSKAPVNTVLSGYLATPNQGEGIYEREGWAAGQSGQRTITFTRTSGGSKAVTYNLEWVGNDGTFSVDGGAKTISLPLNTPVTLKININAATAGVHSAILNLRDASAGNTVAYQTLNTIVAAGQFNAGNNYTVSYSGSADRPDYTTFFFNVPANTPAFKVDLTGISGRIRGTFFHPYGTPAGYVVAAQYQTDGTQSRTLSSPQAGVWEVTVDNSRTSAASPATFTITGSILGVDINPTSWTVDLATVGATYTKDFTFTNRFGAFTGNATGTALGSAFSDRPTIVAGGAQQVYEINVPAGSTSISARTGKPSDNAADLDLFLFDCTGKPCVQKASSTSGSSDEFVSAANPAAGTWKVVVDPYAVPSGSTAYDYVDVFANPTFGAVTVADVAAAHPNGDSWTRTASVTVNAAPTADRFLQGFVQVKSGSTVLGSAEVNLKNVAQQ
jgi:subtilisin family serine protease